MLNSIRSRTNLRKEKKRNVNIRFIKKIKIKKIFRSIIYLQNIELGMSKEPSNLKKEKINETLINISLKKKIKTNISKV
jgi:hypothetical protein